MPCLAWFLWYPKTLIILLRCSCLGALENLAIVWISYMTSYTVGETLVWFIIALSESRERENSLNRAFDEETFPLGSEAVPIQNCTVYSGSNSVLLVCPIILPIGCFQWCDLQWAILLSNSRELVNIQWCPFPLLWSLICSGPNYDSRNHWKPLIISSHSLKRGRTKSWCKWHHSPMHMIMMILFILIFISDINNDDNNSFAADDQWPITSWLICSQPRRRRQSTSHQKWSTCLDFLIAPADQNQGNVLPLTQVKLTANGWW